MSHLATFQHRLLVERQTSRRFRKLTTTTPLNGMQILRDGRTLVNFSSNDYLGISKHPHLKERAAQWLEKYGTGCGASRLVTGNFDIFDQVEAKLARLKGTETALIMGAGFQTNLSVLSAVASEKSFICCDRLSHNSLLQGAISSQSRWTRFHHNDLLDAQKRLASAASVDADCRWIVSESVFSMDGDVADLDQLIETAKHHNAQLLIDDAHATGVSGTNGMGLTSFKPEIDLIIGTFGKALGSYGSYVACSKQMRDFLVNFCGGLIYSTALPPPTLGAIDAALDLVPTLDAERKRLSSISEYVRNELRSIGFSTLNSCTQIIPVVTGSEESALKLSSHLEQHGILAFPIRPPTVPDNTSRIRLSISASHTDQQLESLVAAFKAWGQSRK